ncbi:MAG: preprotein translocase subunit TatC [Nitrososphaerota archaeon]|nr:preprotein translocase subunit TatC [Nitrososphaerota archaeon]
MSLFTGEAESGQKELPFLQHIAELIHRFLIGLGAFFAFFILFFIFKPVWVKVGSVSVFYPYPDLFQSFTTEFFNYAKQQLLPPHMLLINLSAFDTFVAILYTAMALAAIASSPIWLYEAASYLGPALKPREKTMLRAILIPATLLFLAGGLFAYKIVLPVIFKFLYNFTLSTGVEPTLGVGTFVSTVIAYIIALGLSFEIPIIMVAVSYIGLVSYDTWLKNWRYAIVGSFVTALLISPGATGGIIETTIGLTLSALYFGGGVVSRTMALRKQKPKPPETDD